VKTGGRFTAIRTDAVNGGISLGSFLAGVSTTQKLVVDHWNRNVFDNRQVNLRVGTQSQNMYNKPKNRIGGEKPFSQYKGVFKVGGTWGKRTKKRFMARITLNRRRNIPLGCFEKEEDAARAYDEAGRKWCGKFFCPNFPRPDELPPQPPSEVINQREGRSLGSYSKRGYAPHQFHGVHSFRDGWRWRVTINHRDYSGAGFSTDTAAALARDEFIVQNKLPHLRNFPKVQRSQNATDPTEPVLPDS
jgi:hypothetical protein